MTTKERIMENIDKFVGILLEHECDELDWLKFRLATYDKLMSICEEYGALIKDDPLDEEEYGDPDMEKVEEALKLLKEADDWHRETDGEAYDTHADLVPMLRNYREICAVLEAEGLHYSAEDLRGYLRKLVEVGVEETEKLLEKYGLKNLDELDEALKSHGVEPAKKKFRVHVDYDHTFCVDVEAKDSDEAKEIGNKIASERAKAFEKEHGFELEWSGHDTFVDDNP